VLRAAWAGPTSLPPLNFWIHLGAPFIPTQLGGTAREWHSTLLRFNHHTVTIMQENRFLGLTLGYCAWLTPKGCKTMRVMLEGLSDMRLGGEQCLSCLTAQGWQSLQYKKLTWWEVGCIANWIYHCGVPANVPHCRYGEQVLVLLQSLATLRGLHCQQYADSFGSAFGDLFDGYRDVSTKVLQVCGHGRGRQRGTWQQGPAPAGAPFCTPQPPTECPECCSWLASLPHGTCASHESSSSRNGKND